MAFIKKTWLARLGTGLNKFTVNGGNKVALDSAPDSITQEGTPLSAQNMNDLEGRIETAFTGVDTALTGIDTDLTNLAGNFAQIETTPSTHNYSVGDMLVFNGILYKVITAIATNDALVVGSNIEAQTVANAISDIIAYEDITCTMAGGGRWLYGRINDYTNRKLVSVFLLSVINDSIVTILDYAVLSGHEDGSFSIRTVNSTATTGMKVRALTIRK